MFTPAGGASLRGCQHAGHAPQRVRVREEVRRAQDAGGGGAAPPCESWSH